MEELRVLVLTFLTAEGGVVEVCVSGLITSYGTDQRCRIYVKREGGMISRPVIVDDATVDGAVAVEAWARQLTRTEEMIIPVYSFGPWPPGDVAEFAERVFAKVDTGIPEEVDSCFEDLPLQV